MECGRRRGGQHFNIISLVRADLGNTPSAARLSEGTRIVVELVEDLNESALVVCAGYEVTGGREAVEATAWSRRGGSPRHNPRLTRHVGNASAAKWKS